MARRGKSWDEIRNQSNRLLDMNLSSWGSPRRENLIASITSRYVANLQKTETVKKARRQLIAMDKSNRQGRQALMDRVSSKKFSRSTYMGLKSARRAKGMNQP